MCFFRMIFKENERWLTTLFPIWCVFFGLALFCWIIRWIANKGFKRDVLSKATSTLWKITIALDFIGLAVFDCPWCVGMACLFRKEVAEFLNWVGLPCQKIGFLNALLETKYSDKGNRVRTLALLFYSPLVLIGMLVWRYMKTSQIKYPVKEYLAMTGANDDGEAGASRKASIFDIFKWLLVILFFFPFGFLYLLWYWNKKQYEEDKKRYEESPYYSATKVPFEEVLYSMGNSGVAGEYRLYRELCGLEDTGAKFLFNAYVPKWDGTTTELDMICVCSRGMFVFESKNYSGWIFGSENQKEWTQTHKSRRRKGGVHKQRFYNPVMQNQAHIHYLRSFLRSWNEFPIWSVIVFSDNCELKRVNIQSRDVFVVQQYQVRNVVDGLLADKQDIFSEAEVESIYNLLYPITQVSEEVKNQHIADVSRY